VALEQAWRGVQQEQRERAVGLGEAERAFQSPPGGGRVAERLPGHRLQQERVGQPNPRECGWGAVEDRRERGDRRVRVVLGEPQRRGGDARLPVVVVLVAEFGEGLLGALGITQAHQDMN
jgi:hypothetical protein